MKQKKKKHFSKPHRTNDLVMRDMHGVAKFKRTGWAMSWQDMTMIFDHVVWFDFRCREDWVNRFHALIDSYWYQYDCELLKREDLEEMAWEYAGIKINASEVTKDDVKRLARDKYLQMVGMKNLERNNEILKLHSLHSLCAICALHDMGWKEGYINRWQKKVEELMDTIYRGSNSESIRLRFSALERKLNNEGFEYEGIVDWYEESKRGEQSG